MTMTIQVKKKKISTELEAALNALGVNFDKLQPRVDKVFEIGKAEGYTEKEIGKLIRKKMKDHYSQSTIQRMFEKYPEAKQKQNHENDKKVIKITTFDQESNDSKTSNASTAADSTRVWQETIAAKNKVIKQKDEEIIGLKKQLTEKDRQITEYKKAFREWKQKYDELVYATTGMKGAKVEHTTVNPDSLEGKRWQQSMKFMKERGKGQVQDKQHDQDQGKGKDRGAEHKK